MTSHQQRCRLLPQQEQSIRHVALLQQRAQRGSFHPALRPLAHAARLLLLKLRGSRLHLRARPNPSQATLADEKWMQHWETVEAAVTVGTEGQHVRCRIFSTSLSA